MRYVLVPLAIIVTTAMLFTSITPVAACSCGRYPTVEGNVGAADAVIVGTVVGLREEGFVVSVDRYLKGSGATPILVSDAPPNLPPTPREPGDPIIRSSCRSLDHTVLNREFLMYLSLSELAPLGFSTQCYGSTPLDAYVGDGPNPFVAEVETVTGEGTAPTVMVDTAAIDALLEAEQLEPPPPPFELKRAQYGDDFPAQAQWAAAFALPLAFIAGAAVWVRLRRRDHRWT